MVCGVPGHLKLLTLIMAGYFPYSYCFFCPFSLKHFCSIKTSLVTIFGGVSTRVKLEVAKKCGADVVLNPSHCDVVEEVHSLTGGYGCDIYIEATGHPQSVKQGLLMLCKMGTMVEYGVFGQEATVDWTIISDAKVQ
ncbi:Erythritol/L-threitol dehydrogenase [Geodia barretti]|uniref:Erythritol/L-threitol dehydrogenase n=1 Tax=Geodia barretti TaxID=519541 RepID=A0AA35R6L5_GEOBA|nr:Erythritol/L-threitol dehydrogenase [Geodia barretti]